MKYVGSKYQREFMKDLKPVYGAVTKDAGEMALDKLEEKWGEQYPIVIKSWRDNWDRLSEYFQYSETIRKLIYTTNTVEGYHRQIRRAQRTRVFSRTTLPWSNSSTWHIVMPAENGLCLSLIGALSHNSLR